MLQKEGGKTIGVFFILILVTRIILAILQLGMGLFMGINLGKKKMSKLVNVCVSSGRAWSLACVSAGSEMTFSQPHGSAPLLTAGKQKLWS